MATETPTFTARWITSLAPKERDFDVYDAGAPGLCLRVTSKGAKTFRYPLNSIGRKITIGRFSPTEKSGFVTLGEARRWVERLKDAHRAGRLAEVEAELAKVRPRAGPSAPRSPSVPVDGVTFGAVAKEYVEHVTKLGWKSAGEIERALKKDVLDRIGPRSVKAIDAREVRDVVKAVAKRAPTQAAHVFNHIAAVLRHAVGNAEITTNVADALDPAAMGCVERVSQRTLSDEEIVQLWTALDGTGLTLQVRAGLRLLLLTGLRSNELLGTPWSDVDLAAKTLTVPPGRQKLKPQSRANARAFVVPLSTQAMAQVERLRIISEGRPYLLASPTAPDDEKPESPLSDKALIAGMRSLYAPKPNSNGKRRAPPLKFTGERPTPHDLRRSVRTGLSRLGVAPFICERVLNHSLTKILATYDVHDYLEERRDALQRWGDHIDGLLARLSNVVSIGKAARQ